jgi:hypothetical protein
MTLAVTILFDVFLVTAALSLLGVVITNSLHGGSADDPDADVDC